MEPFDRRPLAEAQRSACKRRVAIATILIIFIFQGYAYYSNFLRIDLNFQLYHITNTSLEAAAYSQLFLFSANFIPIFTGLLSDGITNRYNVIVAMGILSVLSSGGLLAVDKCREIVSVECYKNVFTLAQVLLAAGLGSTKTLLMVFGAEQFDDVESRRSMTKWMICTYEVGRRIALIGIVIDASNTRDFMFPFHISICVACAIVLLTFSLMRNFYKLDTVTPTDVFRHIKFAFGYIAPSRCCRYDDDPDDYQELWLTIYDPPPIPITVWNWRIALFHKYRYLLLIFLMFGAYQASYFQANILYALQVKRMVNGIDMPDVWSVLRETTSSLGISSAVIIWSILIYEMLKRKSRCVRRRRLSDFATVLAGTLFGGLSLAAAILLYDHKPGESVRAHVPIEWFSLQYMLYGIGEVFFLCGGYNIAYAESEPQLRATTFAAFQGVGSLFGSLIFLLYYVCTIKDHHTTSFFWPYVCVCIISMLVTWFALPFFIDNYRWAKGVYYEKYELIEPGDMVHYRVPLMVPLDQQEMREH